MALKLLLESLTDHQADEAVNGAVAISKMTSKLGKCCKTPYKLIFVDLNMPVMDGYKMMEIIKVEDIRKSSNSDNK